MKHRTNQALRSLSKYLGLKVKFVGYFKDDIHGKLLPREKRILINAHKPREEHIFTLLHEIGHFLLHFKNAPRKHHPRIFDIHWQIQWLSRLCSQVRRYFRLIFNQESGREWEADLWAFCAFLYLVKPCGCRDELIAFLERHPEKRGRFCLAVLGFVYSGTKAGLLKFRKLLLAPFGAS